MLNMLAVDYHTCVTIEPHVDLDAPWDTQFHELMHGEEVAHVLAEPWAPSIFNDPSYPDLLVVWDHGDGPHNPYPYSDPSLWSVNRALPPSVWDVVQQQLEERGRSDDYVLVWLRGGERA